MADILVRRLRFRKNPTDSRAIVDELPLSGRLILTAGWCMKLSR